MEFLSTYLTAIYDITPNDKEHTHRTALENLLNSIKESLATDNKDLSNLTIKHEPNNDKEGRGAPDFMLLFQGLSVGYIENKRVNADLDSIAQSPQIEKYLKLSDNLILTDYLRFARVCKDEKGKTQIVQECRICELSQIKTALKNKQTLESKTQELLDFFKIFFDISKAKPINTAAEFAQSLALRTQILKSFLEDLQENKNISSVYNKFKTSLYDKLKFEEFADSFAQTLTYSLFLARLNNIENKELDLYNAKKFIPKSFPLIRAMSDFLNQLEDLDSIKWLLEEIIHIINHIDIASIIRELNQASEKDLLGNYTTALHKDPYLHFYETFLSKYDPKLREFRGVYYTPASVVSFIINAIDSVLKADFELKKGLNASLENQRITLLDFATGTGTFLLESFRKALESTPQNSPRYNPKNLLNQFFGFEFLIAPYIIAHLRLSQAFKEEFNAELEDDESLNIKLTNTLYFKFQSREEWEEVLSNSTDAALTQEAKAAQEIKEKEILIITGNPPYSGASANKGLFEAEVQNAYKKPLEILGSPVAFIKNGKIEKEKNPKWLLDDYVKFICFAERKIQKQGSGIFAFISNNSFLDNPTFRGMRYHLLKTFDTIYILDLHGNARKKESAPDGSKDENVFDIMQGVSINIFIKNASCNDDLATLYHYDLYGKRSDKTNFLYENTLDSIAWATLQPKAPFYLFIPQNESLRAEYDKGLSVKDIFKVSSVGVVTGKDSVLIASNEKQLEQQVKDFYNEFDLKFVKNIAYRPFDLMKVYYDTSKVTRPRFEVMQHFLQDFENCAISIPRQLKDINKEWNHCMPTQNITDQALSSGGNGPNTIMPLYLKNTESSKDKSPKKNKKDSQANPDSKQGQWIENFTPEFRKFIDTKYKWSKKDIENYPTFFKEDLTLTPEAILGYIYAVLFHKDYREKYIDFLKIDFPKIPFVESKEKFITLSNLGQELISVHLMQDLATRERERERTEHNENKSQYWTKCGKAIQNERFLAMRDSNQHSCRFVVNGRGQHGSGNNISPLPEGLEMCNLGLVCDRGSKLQEIDNIFITQNIIDLHLVGNGSYVFPLYIKEELC